MRLNEFALNETVGSAGLEYEVQVFEAMRDSGVEGLDPGKAPIGGFSNVGSGDIEATYNDEPFNIEVKLSMKDQMGGGSLQYDRATKSFTPSPKLSASGEPDDIQLLMDATEIKIPDIDAYLDFLKTQEPKDVHAEYADIGIPFVASYDARNEAKKQGYQKAVQNYVKLESRYIKKLYNGKNVFYIQVGGAGLFYMTENPFNLPIPEFEGEINVEIRIGYAGDSQGSISRSFSKKAGSEELIQARRAELRCIGRMLTRSTSPYTLDNEESVRELFGK